MTCPVCKKERSQLFLNQNDPAPRRAQKPATRLARKVSTDKRKAAKADVAPSAVVTEAVRPLFVRVACADCMKSAKVANIKLIDFSNTRDVTSSSF